MLVPVICQNIWRIIKNSHIWRGNMLVRSHFKDEITHVCRKRLEVQEFVAHSPSIFTQITTWNQIDSLSAWCVLRSWKYNYSLILFFSFATVVSLKSKASALSDRNFPTRQSFLTSEKWNEHFFKMYIQLWVELNGSPLWNFQFINLFIK